MDNHMKEQILENAKAFIRDIFHDEFSGHDHFHSIRVFQIASRIAAEEHADVFKVQIAALLHDADDVKLFGKTQSRLPNAMRFMQENGLDADFADDVCSCIETVSYKGTDSQTPETPEAKIVQDADRLDAIGAIGIARAFAFGGNKNRTLYDPDEKPLLDMDEQQYRNRKSCSINHFYEKLLLLKDMMNTESAKRIAEGRHRYMEGFLEEFFSEWEGER